jgi:hypothetical protein
VLLLAISNLSRGQDSLFKIFPLQDGVVTYSSITDIKGKKKDEIFIRIKEWGVNSFKSSKNTLETEDKEIGFIAYKSFFETVDYYWGGISKGKPYKVNVYNTIKFYIKDEKLKVMITDFELEAFGYNYALFKEKEKVPLEIYQNELEERINKGSISRKNEEAWRESNQKFYLRLAEEITLFLDNISSSLTKIKSEFEF